MKHENRNKIVFLAAGGTLVLVALIFFVLPFFFVQKTPLPQRFVDARQSASDVSRDIVSLTTKTNDAIHAIDGLDFSKDREKAVALMEEARNANKEAYNKAFELSQDLQNIAESLAGIRSQESQRIAYDAVATELSLVSEFIAYTQNLQLFLDRITALVHAETSGQREGITESLSAVNEKTRSINELNATFLLKMREFEDSL